MSSSERVSPRLWFDPTIFCLGALSALDCPRIVPGLLRFFSPRPCKISRKIVALSRRRMFRRFSPFVAAAKSPECVFTWRWRKIVGKYVLCDGVAPLGANGSSVFFSMTRIAVRSLRPAVQAAVAERFSRKSGWPSRRTERVVSFRGWSWNRCCGTLQRGIFTYRRGKEPRDTREPRGTRRYDRKAANRANPPPPRCTLA